MKKIIFWILVLVFLLLNACQKGEKIQIERKTLDGTVHVFNPGKSLKGNVTLKVREIQRIDSLSIDKENPPVLNLFARDRENNIFLCDMHAPRMYRFSPEGKLLNQFLIKGEGPGEFPQGIYDFQIIKDRIWLSHSRKLVCFNREGDFIQEWKFDHSITFIEMADDQRLIGNIYKNDLTQERLRELAVFDRNGQMLQSLFQDRNAGFTEIRMQNNGNIQILRFFSAPITNDILHTYDPENKRVYLFLSRDYQIYRKDLQGRTDLVIHRQHQPVLLDEEAKAGIIDDVFPTWDSERRKRLENVFPETFMSINLICTLPRGHIAVRRITGFQKFVFDVFDHSGQFVYVLEPPTEMPDFQRTDLSGNLIWVFRELEDRDIFILYEMTNLPL